MNSQIKNMMIEAGIYECDDFTPHPSFEKFAKILINKCATIALSFDEPFIDGVGNKIHDKLKKHFGVE